MKIILKTKNKKTYFVQLPNYLDEDKINDIAKDAELYLPKGEELVEKTVHSDQITNDERKQLDIYGEIKHPMTQLAVSF